MFSNETCCLEKGLVFWHQTSTLPAVQPLRAALFFFVHVCVCAAYTKLIGEGECAHVFRRHSSLFASGFVRVNRTGRLATRLLRLGSR